MKAKDIFEKQYPMGILSKLITLINKSDGRFSNKKEAEDILSKSANGFFSLSRVPRKKGNTEADIEFWYIKCDQYGVVTAKVDSGKGNKSYFQRK